MIRSAAMIPTDHRLDAVVARLIERLEATRPSWDAGSAEQAARRVAEEHLGATMAEVRELGLTQRPDRHERFLRREVLETFLPRYLRLAAEMQRLEATHFGFGALAEPRGRLLLGGASLLGLVLLVRFAYLPLVWMLIVAVLSVAFWPDVARQLGHRRYERELRAILHDMHRIQEQAAAWLTVGDDEDGTWRESS